MGDWTFFSNYGHVLVCLARNRDARLRDVAEEVGVTERAVQKIVRDLQGAGYLTVSKHGRCNRYRINKRKSLRHALEAHCTVGRLLALVAGPARPGQQAEPDDAAAEAPAVAQRAAAAAGQPGDKPAPAESVPAKPVPAKPVPAEPVPAEPAPQTEAAPAEKAGKKKRSAVDTRSQGSLF